MRPCFWLTERIPRFRFPVQPDRVKNSFGRVPLHSFTKNQQMSRVYEGNVKFQCGYDPTSCCRYSVLALTVSLTSGEKL
jgi:hypothetical protein